MDESLPSRERGLKHGGSPAYAGIDPRNTLACWVKKNQDTHLGYKNHISVDNKHKMIRAYEVTSAEVHGLG